ncbi:hypothetical protein BU24DRAFT_395102 [Aaosphaeria arxii CBS 175.79]|uniref:Alpha/beta-hydrolase n=1 Tax=Aaosphaeria arxii CBS 175.79 TaxID=1450172 RepID=A0A6A5XNP6_9PLEO|nr:uncharacterized protein BU24DRAFT_395102 [Aaosphaeria arxii CBS 175.79]KAF2013974.1 hypothetical protein BU24DRAFT_395102 [Aaosphaeria arxii CBS 175.79]
MRLQSATALQALALSSTAIAKPIFGRAQNETKIYDFAQLESSPELKWTPCFEDFTCARLEVPLDYEDLDVGTTDIAFIKWTSNSTNASSAHDILLNPGGPGGSGVQFLRSSLNDMLLTLGFDNNLVGFDPRGVNNSGPDLSCFPGQTGTARLYDDDFNTAVDINSSSTITDAFARAGAFGEWCTQAHSGPNDTAKYANTVATATDMLHYTELAAEARGESAEDAELWYYGASYGTILGSTAAALFPDRIGRMILDGVVDAEDYYLGAWSNNLVDGDAAISTFFKYCHEGGNTSCAFWDESPEAIEERFNAVIEDVRQNPITVSDPTFVKKPTIITTRDLHSALTTVPYQPLILFPILGLVMSHLEQRNGTVLAQFLGSAAPQDQCENPPTFEVSDVEPRYFIACNDANGRYNLSTVEKFTEQVEQQFELSKYMGESWAAGTSINCRKLEVFAPDSQVFEGVPSANKTSNPILFVGNTYDPVTPLTHAKSMSKRFAGSGVLQQDSVGHCTLAAPSKCTWKVTQKYILDATLPAEGTVCEPDEVPFEKPLGSILGSADTKILKKRHHIQAGKMGW